MKKALGVAAISASMVVTSMMLSACGSGSTAGAMLFCVGKTPIEQADFAHWVSVMATMSPAAAQALTADSSEGTTTRQRARLFLIRAARASGEAREQGIRLSDAEIAVALAPGRYGLPASAAEAALASALRSPAETAADRLSIARTSLLAEKLSQALRSKAEREIPRAQLAAYLSRHRREFVLPERRDVGVVQSFTKANADLARRELEAGRSLRSVVERRNNETDVGGMKRNMTRQTLGHAYEVDYFTAKPHVIVGPRKFQIYYLFEVAAVKPRRQQSLAEVEPVIRQRLISGQARDLLAAATRALDARWRVNSNCSTAHS